MERLLWISLCRLLAKAAMSSKTRAICEKVGVVWPWGMGAAKWQEPEKNQAEEEEEGGEWKRAAST